MVLFLLGPRLQCTYLASWPIPRIPRLTQKNHFSRSCLWPESGIIRSSSVAEKDLRRKVLSRPLLPERCFRAGHNSLGSKRELYGRAWSQVLSFPPRQFRLHKKNSGTSCRNDWTAVLPTQILPTQILQERLSATVGVTLKSDVFITFRENTM